jgi:hypothetical protein
MSARRGPATGYRVAPTGAAAAVGLLMSVQPLHAQPPPAGSNRTVNVNYVYAANLGFGSYSLAGLSADVFTLPLGYTVPRGPEGGWRLRLTLPVQLGLYSFRATDVDGTPIKINQQSLAVLPGVELQVPLARNIVLKPFAQAGVGHAFGATSGANAFIYTVGIRSVVQWQVGQYTLSLGNAILYAGDRASNFSESYFAIEGGFELRRPLGFTFHGVEPDIGVYVADYYYPKPLLFSRFLRDPLKVSDQGEVGFSIGSARPLRMALLESARIGIGYVFGGGLSVWHVNFGFPF